MPNSTPNTPEDSHLRLGIRVSLCSLVWTLFASAIEIAIGFNRESLVLIAFGFTGVLDAAGSAALIVHFRHARKHDVFSEAHERFAFLVVTIGLVVVALGTLAGSVQRLAQGGQPGHSTIGLVIAAASIFILGALSYAKRKIGLALPSPALVADGLLSSTGALLAAVTVCGSLLAQAGASWADPVAAIAVALGALGIVGVMHRQV